MKTPSRTFIYIALAVVAIVAVLSLRAFATAPHQQTDPLKFFLKFSGPTNDEYLEVKQPDFDNALYDLKQKGGQYTVKYKANATSTPIEDYHAPHHSASIKTDRVITSDIAKTASADASVGNDPNAVYHLSSNDATDVQTVLKAFK